MPNDQIYSGSSANDYQPSTNNPQANASSNLQPGANNLQPLSQQTGGSSQSFPQVDQLKVVSVENYPQTSGSALTPAGTINNGLSLGWEIVIALLIISLIAAFWLAIPHFFTYGVETVPEPSKKASKSSKNKKTKPKNRLK